MSLDAFIDKDADILIQNVESKTKRIFEGFEPSQQRAIYRYQFSRKPKKLPPSMKNRIINLYDPMANRSHKFHDGLRWCANIYVGCYHNCGYCYVNGYSQNNVGISPHPKKDFCKNIEKDIKDLKILGVPATSIHMSNSTDPLQAGLEEKHRHTLFTLQNTIDNRNLFTSIVILTKNPRTLLGDDYLPIISDPSIKPFTVQVTCAFWRDKIRSFYEPAAPAIKDRLDAIKKLTRLGVDVELRIDPLFPSTRVDKTIHNHKALPKYGIPEAQTMEDIKAIVKFGKDSGVSSIIAKPLKVPVSKKAQRCKDWFKILYKDANNGRGGTIRGGSWRLPGNYQKALVVSVREACDTVGINFKHCMHDVMTRK